jgi:hypothetical protein
MYTGTMSECRLDNIRRAIVDIKTEGHILEFGVFEGWSLSEITFTARRRKLPNKIIGFDSFIGIPETEGVYKKGDFSSTLENTKQHMKKLLGHIDDITFIEGVFETSLTQELKDQLKIHHIALLHVDSDTYAAAKLVLEWCKSYIKSGTIIVFDEYTDGEDRAFAELCTHNELRFKERARCDTQVVVEII